MFKGHLQGRLKPPSNLSFVEGSFSSQHQLQQAFSDSDKHITHFTIKNTQTSTTVNMDSGRKDASDKFTDKVTPDNSKSTLDKAKEGVTDAGDKIQR